MENNDNEIVLTEEEIEEEREKMGRGVYEHIFRKPFEWEGKTYGKLVFDFEKLTGRDTLAIERELSAKGIYTIVRRLNIEFQMRVAARACNEKLGTDALEAMPIRDFEQIMNRVSGFFSVTD